MKLKWIVLAIVAAAAAGCGKPKPREVIELRVDGQAAELKSDQLAQLAAQVQGLCELAEFLGSQVSSATVGSEAPSGGARITQLMRLESSSTDKGGPKTVVNSTATTVLSDGLVEAIKTYGQMTGKQLDPEAVAKLRSGLESVRGGWRVATLYHSDTATQEALKDFDQYRYLLARITPNRLHCLRESVQRDAVRR